MAKAPPKPCKHSDPPCTACKKNRARVRAYDRAHRTLHALRSAKWKQRNPDRVKEATQRNNRARRYRKRALAAVDAAERAGCKQVEVIDIRDIYQRDHGVCSICFHFVPAPGEPCDVSEEPTLDHIIPKSWKYGPGHVESNVRLAHRACNSRKGTKVIPEPDLSDVPF